MSYAIPERELLYPGHVACPGCGAALAMRLALKALGDDLVVIIVASCWSIIAGPFPYSSLRVPTLHSAFETGGSAAAGVKAALEMRGHPDTTVMTWAGDGGTFDIGIQALSGAVERNEDFIYVCYDNEAYMNTGIQRSSATPWGAWTTTTPLTAPKNTPKKDIVAIMAAHKIPYTATATVAYPEDLVLKLQKAARIRGSKFIHILAPCPSGWKSEPGETIKVSRLAVQSKVFPLYEIENGERYTITVCPRQVPVIEYLQRQGRFDHLSMEQIEQIQDNVDSAWQNLLTRAG
jgi:pyruvate/2-oxoacid:ferredoxin oxidoreductase beta subunit